MNFHYLPSLEKREKTDAIVVPCFENEKELFSYPQDLPEEVLKRLSSVASLNDFTGKKDEILILYSDDCTLPRIILLGLGLLKSVDDETLREAYASLLTTLSKKKLASLLILLPDIHGRKSSSVLLAAMEGFVYGSYQFSRYKKSEFHFPEIFIPYHSLEEFTLVQRRILAFRKALNFTRDMVNANAHDKYPEAFGAAFLAEAKGSGLVTTLYDEEWMKKEKMGLLLAVGQGSRTPPRLLVISWKPMPKDVDHTVLVGKGITFDTGGLNLKPTGSMETMKDDMSGAAAVAGVMLALAELQVQKNVTAVIPLAENAIGSGSYKPGDVFRARSGITVEVTNTDAEGRLVLADALDFAKTDLAPTRIIDIATLTGACEVALGAEISGLFSNSDALAFEFEKASKKASEPVWRFPLYEGYRDLLRSDIADTKNSSIRIGSAIIAALFLEKFIDTLPWIHLDIAGPPYSKDGRKYYGKGATGAPLRTLFEYLHPYEL